MSCKTEVFSRVTGFYRPTQDWNPGKVAEFHDRKHYELSLQDKIEIAKADAYNELLWGGK